MTALVGARFGLISDQMPPPPLWQVEMQLEDVTIKRPIAGRSIANLDGKMRIDNERAVLQANALIDGAKMRVALTEPVDGSAGVTRTREISGTLDDAARAKIAPALSGIVKGPVGIDVSLAEDGSQAVKADLGKAVLSLPWIGWSKGAGIAAQAAFTIRPVGSTTEINDLRSPVRVFAAPANCASTNRVLRRRGCATCGSQAETISAVTVGRSNGRLFGGPDRTAADIRRRSPREERIGLERLGQCEDQCRLDRVTGVNGPKCSRM